MLIILSFLKRLATNKDTDIYFKCNLSSLMILELPNESWKLNLKLNQHWHLCETLPVWCTRDKQRGAFGPRTTRQFLLPLRSIPGGWFHSIISPEQIKHLSFSVYLITLLLFTSNLVCVYLHKHIWTLVDASLKDQRLYFLYSVLIWETALYVLPFYVGLLNLSFSFNRGIFGIVVTWT